MIIKSFELNKIKKNNIKYYLFYGENEGFKIETISNVFDTKSSGNIYRYDEKEILDNPDNFLNSIISKSFFEDEKLIIISRVDDKIFPMIEEIMEKNLDDIKIILNAGLLEKKSKLRGLFEKNKDTICVAFYADNNQTLNTFVSNFFRGKKISISQELINLLVERCRGNRQNLKNELAKIDSFIVNKKNINLDQIIKLTNLAENYSVNELIDNCLAKNSKKIINILNENNYSLEDCILIARTLLNKAKRLHKIKNEIDNNKKIDQVITSFKPAIFWKDKTIVKLQVKNWTTDKIENLIYETSQLELLIKKNSVNSINILSDFIITNSNN